MVVFSRKVLVPVEVVVLGWSGLVVACSLPFQDLISKYLQVFPLIETSKINTDL